MRLHYTADPEKRDPEWRKKARAGYAAWAWAREFEIDFTSRGGQKVYEMWDPEVHEVRMGTMPETWTRYRGLDHGLANPTAVVWAAVDPDNDVHIYREYYRAERTIAENCRHILEMEGKTETVRGTYGDPSLYQRDPKDMSFLADEYARTGIAIIPGNNMKGVDPVCRHLVCALAKWSKKNERVHPYFEEQGWDEKEVDDLSRQPAVYFSTACQNTIREHRNWRIREVSRPETHNKSEKPEDKDDHTCDAVRYLLAADIRYRQVEVRVPYHPRMMMRRAGY